MSLAGSSERIGFLRETLARIEARTASADAAAQSDMAVSVDPIGWRWGRRLSVSTGCSAAVSGSVLCTTSWRHTRAMQPRLPVLPRRWRSASVIARPHGAFVWLIEDAGIREEGLPYAPGLRLTGLDPARLILVRTLNVRDTLWVMEEALKCQGVSAVLAETWAKSRDYSLTVSRRLALAAKAGGTAGLLRHARAAGEAEAMTSAAAIRFEIAARRSLARAASWARAAAARSCRMGRAGRQDARRCRRSRTRRSIGRNSPMLRGITRRPVSVMRCLSLWLPRLATDRLTRLQAAKAPSCLRNSIPLAPASPGLATWTKIKGAQRLASVDARAQAAGLRPGMTLADARAMLPSLEIAEADPRAEAELLAAITDWCRRFTPLAALDAPDGVLLDVSGAAHLFGGEEALLAEIIAALARQGFVVRAALAPNPALAWALARFSDVKRVPPDVPERALQKLAANMPVAALRIEAETIAALAQAGLRRIDDLLMRPRAPIAARFGAGLVARLDAILGVRGDPLSPRFETAALSRRAALCRRHCATRRHRGDDCGPCARTLRASRTP